MVEMEMEMEMEMEVQLTWDAYHLYDQVLYQGGKHSPPTDNGLEPSWAALPDAAAGHREAEHVVDSRRARTNITTISDSRSHISSHAGQVDDNTRTNHKLEE